MARAAARPMASCWLTSMRPPSLPLESDESEPLLDRRRFLSFLCLRSLSRPRFFSLLRCLCLEPRLSLCDPMAAGSGTGGGGRCLLLEGLPPGAAVLDATWIAGNVRPG